MRLVKRNIIRAFAIIFLMIAQTSCNKYDINQSDDDEYLIVLRVNSLEGSLSNSDIGDNHEMVKSLRVIMLNDGAVELNRYMVMGQTPEGINMADLDYVLTAKTVEGSKRFYLFANEESVGSLQFKSTLPLPDNLPNNLHDYLESVIPDIENTQSGQNFEDIINAIYFQPQYSKDSSGNVYLPYSSFYDGYEVGSKSSLNVDNFLQMYIVPVATKFMFQFINYRPNPVDVKKITVLSKNIDNFFLARVNKPDDAKTFEGAEYYWVDWLAKISEASRNNADYYDNVTFNEKYGWIINYDMPDNFIEEADFITEDTYKTVPAGERDVESEEIKPSSMILGPFYVPESWNEYTQINENTGEEITVQRYGLTLNLHDTSPTASRDPVFENVTIDNLQALFRNTCVLIKITMIAGTVEVYAEINPWTIKKANGWLVEGNAPPI